MSSKVLDGTRAVHGLLFAVALAFFLPATARAAALYKIQPIARVGDKVGDLQIRATADFEPGSLNDNGQCVFVTENQAGGEMLVLYSDGKLTPIAAGGLDGPNGPWPQKSVFSSPVGLNQSGNIAFGAGTGPSQLSWDGIYLWDAATRKITSLEAKGMPAVNGLTFGQLVTTSPAALNNGGDIAFPAQLKNGTQTVTGNALFFRGRDGQLQAVALPDQPLPGGEKVADAWGPSLNDAGRVAFMASTKRNGQGNAYIWENGTISPVLGIGADLPEGTKVIGVGFALVNNKNRSLLIGAHPKLNVPDNLYLWTDGKLSPVLAVGQEMPEGGKFRDYSPGGISYYPNSAGQFAIVALITDAGVSRTAAYLVDADGKLSLILKTGATTDLGTVTQITLPSASPPSLGLAVNAKGQVLLPLKIDTGATTLALLTPQ